MIADTVYLELEKKFPAPTVPLAGIILPIPVLVSHDMVD